MTKLASVIKAQRTMLSVIPLLVFYQKIKGQEALLR